MNSIIIVADSSSARIFSSESVRSKYTELMALENNAWHQDEECHTSEVQADIPSDDTTHHSDQAHGSPKQNAIKVFAHEVVGFVEQIYRLDGLGHLIVIASADFIGLLRKAMPAEMKAHIIFEKPKNLTKLSSGSIRTHLMAYLEI